METSRSSTLILASIFATVVIGVTTGTGCSDDPAPVAPVVVAPDAGPPARVDASADAQPEAASASCAKVAGVYGFTDASCTPATGRLPQLLCLRQRGCAVTGLTNFSGRNLAGTATDLGVSATTESPTSTCTGTIANGALSQFTCNAAGVSCTGKPTLAPIPEATDFCCSVRTQDCATGERCQPRSRSGAALLVNVCVPDRGTVDLNGSCQRLTAEAKDVGNDDCKKGLFCANVDPAALATGVCRKLCADNPDCTGGDACFVIDGIDAGTCVPRCSLFAPSGPTACSPDSTCRFNLSRAGGKLLLDTRCQAAGAGAEGSACERNSDCGQNLGCNAARKCSPFCDTAHPCATGTCSPAVEERVAGLDASTGQCE